MKSPSNSGETPEQLQRHLLELLVIEAYRTERITHFQVGQLLKLLSRWAVDAFLLLEWNSRVVY